MKSKDGNNYTKDHAFKVGQDDRGKGLEQKTEQTILVSVHLPDQSEQQITEYLDELEFLALTAGAETVKRFVQRLPHPDTRFFIGKGKMEEIATYIATPQRARPACDGRCGGRGQRALAATNGIRRGGAGLTGVLASLT